MKYISPLLLFIAIICLPGIPAIAQSSPGKLVLSKGQKFQIDNNVKSVINQEMMGQSIEIKTDANMVHQLEVKEKKNNAYLVSSTLTRLTSSGSAMGQEMNFDSEKKEDLEGEMGQALKDQLNVAKEAEFNEKAKVIRGISKDTAAGASGQMAEMIKRFAGSAGDESNGAVVAFEVIPAGKKVGDSWSDSTITEQVKTYKNYTFKELNGNNASLSITGKQLTQMKMEQQGMEIHVSMEGNITEEGIVDIKTGLVKQRNSVLDGTGTTEVMGQSIPSKIKVTTITTVTQK
ncbi:MAG: hypothetical protein JWP81_3814 [Ferruginibacter sp.]|nr:hypothetical protein [Ferruginibacter sp.]